MKLLLIKVGKAWNVLKRDGLWRGTKRVVKAFLDLFKRVEPGDILFISNGVGDSARYRTSNVAEELRNKGFRASVTVQDNPFLLSYADQFSVFVFHRVLVTEKVQQLVGKLKALNKEIIFETDDLVYDPEFLKHMDYYTKMNALEKELYKNGLGGEILNDPYVTVATTTTSFLAEKLQEKGKKVFVVRNKLSHQDLLWGEAALKKAKKDPSVIKLCYLSGTISHNKDFATITSVLIELLKKYPQLRLVLAGPLDVNSALNAYAAQIERVPFVGRKEYFENVATYDINVAPLEIGNPFCESKSELKWFEAGMVAVPTVAAATRTFREAIEDGVDGLVADTPEAWKEKIEVLMNDPALRMAMGQRAKEATLARYTTQNGQEAEYYNYLKEKI